MGVTPSSRSQSVDVMLTLESAAGCAVVCDIVYSFSEREERVGERECVLETSSMVLKAGCAVEEGWREGVGRVMVRTLVTEGDFSFKEAILAVCVNCGRGW
jgi:hypothetical protein